MNVDFEEIYQKIISNAKEELEKIKSNNNKSVLHILLVAIALCFLTYVIYPSLLLIVILFSFIILITVICRNQYTYRKLYKSKVIESLVHEYNKSLNFYSDSDMTRLEYLRSDFDRSFSRFSTEDKICGKLSDESYIKMAQVSTYDEETYTDSNGNTQIKEVETFRGLYGYINLKNYFPNSIRISTNSFFNKYNDKRIEVESAEFEKLFDLYATDKIQAMQIFTTDLIEKFITLNFNNKASFEIKINENIIYFRYRCGEVFEPPAINTGIDHDLLHKYFLIINYPIQIIEGIIENSKKII